MSTFLTVLIILVSILLVLVVLVQNSKGGGIASNFAASNQVMGVQKTTEVVEKITWGLVIALVVLSITASFVYKAGNVAVVKDSEIKEMVTTKKAAPAPAPAEKPAEGLPAEKVAK